jgi:hypothetical protein
VQEEERVTVSEDEAADGGEEGTGDNVLGADESAETAGFSVFGRRDIFERIK